MDSECRGCDELRERRLRVPRTTALCLWMQPMRRLPMVVLSAGIVAVALVVSAALVDADTDVLGTVVIQVEQAASSETYGYLAGGFGFGQIVSGEWPGALFTDGSPRAVESVRETPAGWFLGAENTDAALEDPGPALADPVAEPDTLVAFIAEATPGGGVVAQGLIVIVVWYLYLVAPTCCCWPAGYRWCLASVSRSPRPS